MMRSPAFVAIINLSADSFAHHLTTPSDEHLFHAINHALSHGASMVDIGAESTRPQATALTATEEWERLQPLYRLLQKHPELRKHISLDSYHSETIARFLQADLIAWVNDVSGGADREVFTLLARYPEKKYVMMHQLGIPANPDHILPTDSDVTHTIIAWAKKSVATCVQHGMVQQQVIIDAGIGFGKNAAQSLELIERAGQIKQALSVPLLYGHSEKSFLSAFTSQPAGKRTALTCATSWYLACQQVEYLRVHDVAAHRDFFALQRALYA